MIYSSFPLFSKSLKLTSLSVTAPISIDPAMRASDKVDIRQEPEKPREVSHVDRLVRGIIDGFGRVVINRESGWWQRTLLHNLTSVARR